jgi:hypothetical protein
MGTIRATQEYVEVLFADPFSVTAREFTPTASSTLVVRDTSGHSAIRRYERFANNAGSQLVSAIDADDATLTVVSADTFPTEGNFRIIVDTEIMVVIAVVGTTFKILRGQEGTSAASHSTNAGVFHVVTADSLASRDSDARASDLFVNRDSPGQSGRMYIPNTGYVARDSGIVWESLPLWKMVPPVLGDFTWENQGTSSATDVKGAIVLAPQTVASGESLRMLLKAAPTPPYKITIAFCALSGAKNTGNGSQYGFCWRDSATGKVITWGPGCDSSGYAPRIYHTRWTNSTTVTTQVAGYYPPPIHPFWFRMGDDGTNRTMEISGDGYKFNGIAPPEARATHLTADQVGIFANSYLSSTNVGRQVTFFHWSQS